jgi:hypothetical protein
MKRDDADMQVELVAEHVVANTTAMEINNYERRTLSRNYRSSATTFTWRYAR